MNRLLLIAAGVIACIQVIPEAGSQGLDHERLQHVLRCAQSTDGQLPASPIPLSIDQCARWDFTLEPGAITRDTDTFAALTGHVVHESHDPMGSIQSEITSSAALAKSGVEPEFNAPRKPSPGVAIAKADIPEYQDITRTLQAWAQAWSKKDLDSYLGYYARDFQTSDSRLTPEQWRQQRRQRIGRAGAVEVKVRDLKIELVSTDRADAVFTQEYRAAGRTETLRKVMQLKRQDRQWRIAAEQSEP